MFSKKRSHSITLLPLVLVVATRIGWAEPKMLDHEPVLPPNVDFVRSFDAEMWAGPTNANGSGMHSGRFRFRFRDPGVDAFVGLVAAFHHFNDRLHIGEDLDMDSSELMANWGGAFGVVRGKHLWELDVMGVNLSKRLGGAFAIVGEHQLPKRWIFYHRTELNIFTTDAILDADQGFYWMWKPQFGLSLGYRWFTSSHMDRSGPHLGIRLYFESPKIPFMFPSLG